VRALGPPTIYNGEGVVEYGFSGGRGGEGREQTDHDGDVFIVDAVVVDGRLEQVTILLEPWISERLSECTVGCLSGIPCERLRRLTTWAH